MESGTGEVTSGPQAQVRSLVGLLQFAMVVVSHCPPRSHVDRVDHVSRFDMGEA